MRTLLRRLLGFPFGAVVVAMTLAGCMSSADVISGRHWTLASINGNAPAAPASIEFTTGGLLSVETGCNTGTAQFTLQGNRLALVNGLATTLMGCPDPQVSAQETVITGVVGSSPIFAIDTGTGQLRLTGNGAVLLFNAPQG